MNPPKHKWRRDIVDVDLGPKELFVVAPVTLEINYAGTSNNPYSSNYGREPTD